jgi:ribonucleoside-diphosphate reductase alpha chain
MMAEVQPFISGAISKTVNLPADATIADVANLSWQAFARKVKAVAVYRDGSKLSQPLNVAALDESDANSAANDDQNNTQASTHAGATEAAEPTPSNHDTQRPQRRRLPNECPSSRLKFELGGHAFYLHVGFCEDGTPGEVFIRGAREGSSMSGVLDAVGRLASMLLQYGVEPSEVARALEGSRFEPSGFVHGHPSIKFATSPLDVVGRHLASLLERGQQSPQPAPLASPQGPAVVSTSSRHAKHGEPCPNCGNFALERAGSCFACRSCGATTGCS